MTCQVQRNSDGRIEEVKLPDGTLSPAYAQILHALSEGIDSVHFGAAMSSLIDNYVGKYIRNVDNIEEVALGIYMFMYQPEFKQWYGNWTNNEPKLDAELNVIKGKEKRSLLNMGPVKTSLDTTLRSARTKKVKGLIRSVDTTVRELKQRIKMHVNAREKALLNREYTREQKVEREAYYNRLIDIAKKQIETLQKQNDQAYVFGTGLSDMRTIDDLLTGPTVSLSEVRQADDIVKTWLNIHRILGVDTIDDITDKADREKAEEILAQANQHNRKIANMAKKLLVETINKNLAADKQITEKDVNNMKDVNWVHSKTRDISSVDNRTIGYLAKIMQEVNLRIEREHQQNHRLIDSMWNKIKNHPLIKQMGMDLFIKEQFSRKGELVTLGLRGRYSQAYYEAVRKHYAQRKKNLDITKNNKEATKAVWKNHNDWVRTNNIIFNSALFINTNKYTDEQRLAEIERLRKDGFTAEEVQDIIREARRKYELYIKDAENYRIALEQGVLKGDIEIDEDMTADEYIDQQVKEWKEINDPIGYVQMILGAEMAGRHYKGSKYTITIPRKQIDGEDTGYYDDDFAKIAADKDLYEFYLFFRDFIKEQLSYLPQDEIDHLQSNFLPVITDRIAKEYGLSGLKESVKGIGDWFFKQMTTIEYEDMGAVKPTTGEKKYGFKPRFLKNNVDVTERSKDMVLMMKLFSDMALIYKHKIQIQDTVDTVGSLVQDMQYTLEKDQFGNMVSVNKAPVNLQNMVKSSILQGYYNVPGKAEGVLEKKFYSAAELLSLGLIKSEKYERAKKLEEEIRVLTEKLEDPNIKPEERLKGEELLYAKKEEYYELGGRTLSASSVLDAMNKLTRQKGIAFNPFSAFRNLMIGGINNYIHAYGGEDFNTKTLNKATNIVKASSAKYLTWGTAKSKDAEKILKIMLESKTIDGEDQIFANGVTGINKNSTWEAIKSVIPTPFGLMKSTDYFFRSQTAIAMLLNTKVVTSKGTFNMYEVLDENLNFNEAEFGEWSKEQNKGKNFEDFYIDSLLKLGQVSKKLHGFSGGGQTLAAKESIMGRMLMVFRTWLPETLATRFEGKRYDSILERDTEGYYRTFFKNFVGDDGLRLNAAFKEFYQALVKGEVEGMSKEDVANLRKMGMELAVIMALSLTYLLLKAVAGDDDKEDKRMVYLLINQFELLNRDMQYYLNPKSFGELTSNFVPSVVTFNQAADALSAVGYYAAGTENEDGEVMYDGERTALKISKALPYVNNVNRVIYYSSRLGDVR